MEPRFGILSRNNRRTRNRPNKPRTQIQLDLKKNEPELKIKFAP